MGRRGPPPTPTKLLQMRGSWRANARKGEPEPSSRDARVPRRPEFLRAIGREAVAAWDWIAPRLGRMKILTGIDRDALARWCVMWAQWRAAVDYIAKNGPTLEKTILTQDGYVTEVKDHPAVARSMRLEERLTKLGAKFGMTPADRRAMAGATAGEQPRDDLMDAISSKPEKR